MTEDEIIVLASRGLKKPLTTNHLFADEIELSHLKRIDKIFEKGLQYYINPSQPLQSDEASFIMSKFVRGFKKLTANAVINDISLPLVSERGAHGSAFLTQQ